MYIPIPPEQRASEDAALRELINLGVAIKSDEPEPSRTTGCMFCEFHAYDSDGNDVDGGRPTLLLSMMRDNYYQIAYLRPVRR